MTNTLYVGDPVDIARDIDRERISKDKIVPLGCGIYPKLIGESKLKCAVLIME